MAIVNTAEPITSQKAEAYLTQLVKAYPFCKLEKIGQSVLGRPVWALTVGKGKRRVLYSGAHHANEWITALLLLSFGENYAAAVAAGGKIYDTDAKALFESTTVCIVPMVDPDGVDLVTGALPEAAQLRARELSENYPAIPFPNGWKANLNGVDLNLNYPARWLLAREIKFSQGYTRPGPRDYVGKAPLNQPESRALADFTREFEPDLVLAFHAQGKEIYWQFDDIYVPGAEELGQAFAAASGYTLTNPPANSSNAGYKDWFIQVFRRPGYTVEVGRGVSPLPLSQFPEIYRDNLGILILAAKAN